MASSLTSLPRLPECLLRRFTELVQLPDSFSANCSGAVSASFWTAATWIAVPASCQVDQRLMFSFPAMDWTACTGRQLCDSDLAMMRSGPARVGGSRSQSGSTQRSSPLAASPKFLEVCFGQLLGQAVVSFGDVRTRPSTRSTNGRRFSLADKTAPRRAWCSAWFCPVRSRSIVVRSPGDRREVSAEKRRGLPLIHGHCRAGDSPLGNASRIIRRHESR